MAKWGPSMHESSGSLSSSPFDCTLEYRKGSANGIANFSGPFSRARYGVRPQLLENFNLVGLTIPNPVEIAVSTSYGPAGGALLPRRSQGSVRVDSRPSPKTLSWVGSCPTPKALPWVDSNPSPRALSWMGSCPARNMLPWVGSLSPLPHFKSFAHTSHV